MSFYLKNHPLATASSLNFQDLVDQSFILLDEHFVHLKAFELSNQKYQNRAEIFFKSDDIVRSGARNEGYTKPWTIR